jgi:hypothetical protein
VVPERVLKDTKYAFNILFVEQSCNRPGQADKVVEFVRAGSETGNEIDRVVFKDRERAKYKPAQIVAEMRSAVLHGLTCQSILKSGAHSTPKIRRMDTASSWLITNGTITITGSKKWPSIAKRGTEPTGKLTAKQDAKKADKPAAAHTRKRA